MELLLVEEGVRVGVLSVFDKLLRLLLLERVLLPSVCAAALRAARSQVPAATAAVSGGGPATTLQGTAAEGQ